MQIPHLVLPVLNFDHLARAVDRPPREHVVDDGGRNDHE